MNPFAIGQFGGNIAAIAGGGSAVPPIPDQSNLVLGCGLFNLNAVGYPEEISAIVEGVETNSFSPTFFGTSPYACKINAILMDGDAMSPPFLVNAFADQNSSSNNLTQSGAARPVLQVTTPVIVFGAGTAAANGTYTYRGQHNARPYYTLFGQPDSFDNYAIYYEGGNWMLTGAAGSQLYVDEGGTQQFPWQNVWDVWNDGDSPAPTVTAGTGSGWIQGATGQGLGGGALYAGGSATGTINLLVYIDDFAATQVIFETGQGDVRNHIIRQISIKMVAGVLTASIFDTTAIAALPNTKVKTLSVAGWYNIALTFDTGVVTAANQTVLKVNDSTSGVTSAAAADLFGLLIGGTWPLNFMCRDAAGTPSNAFTGRALMCFAYSDVKDAAWQTQNYNYGQYLLEYNGYI